MLIWIVFAVIATAVIASLLHPFASGLARIDSGAADACRVYRDQLVDLDRDMETSQLPRNEYEYARAEIARRLFKATEQQCEERRRPPHAHRWPKLAISLFLPLASIGLYARLGSPDMPSQPLQARLEDPGHNIAMLISKTERHLASQPDDGRGWNVIAPVYLRTGRIAEAKSAYRNALRILGPDVDRLGGLAEALMIEAQGSVTADTLDILRQILRLEPKNPRALFYIAVGMEQAGRTTEALADFEALAKLSPAGAAWLPLVNQHISANGGVPLAASRQKPHMTAAGDSR
ncbi:c-type cytochrome biogenesis protein CcmI [Rhizobium sp. NLR9b]|uniref:c-type cytochrome biogenesis protein CcmI n=1 Tax=unclassified Rhizobium TaxID=2613769 RepID=UPI001C8315EB|nr:MULTISPECIES: c-type cytochrome biogenesis protein CcmI [unclassified Rhizobium]MBX5230514.1 c-type cytochrome biogenesis protein CcmI [Rhizobium sp. NLR9b]MBX5291182.1 c-type cytochrome biogenesis protein CcmI [Rhizobium sp. NLR10b]